MVKYYNRKTRTYEIEKVVKEKYLNYVYTSRPGMSFLEHFLKRKAFTSLIGRICDTRVSKRKIKKFIKNYHIDTALLKKSPEEFSSFNDFFIRELKENARPINMESDVLISPCDGKIYAFDGINENELFNIKGFSYSLSELVDDKSLIDKYIGGTCIILRLCPTDYHRFHFIDYGTCDKVKKIKGNYYSVNPVALSKIPEILCKNKREWSIFHSENFGDVIYVEVGATCVGTIVQTYVPNKKVSKGDEKGYFKFGGSTVMLIFEGGKINIDRDIIEQTSKKFETAVLMGEKIGKKVK